MKFANKDFSENHRETMEYCPYDTAFEIPQKEEKKKKRKHKNTLHLDLDPDLDPDRPASLTYGTSLLNPQTFNEAFIDISPFSSDGGKNKDISPLGINNHSNITVPIINVTDSKPLPKYFLNGDDNTLDYAEAFTDVIGSTTATTSSTQSSSTQSTQSSSTPSSITSFLPLSPLSSESLSLDDNWKPATSSNSYTAFFDSTFQSAPNPQIKSVKFNPKSQSSKIQSLTSQSSSDNDITSKINLLFKRLDALEKEYKGDTNPNNQKEILYFVGTGFVFLFSLNLLRR